MASINKSCLSCKNRVIVLGKTGIVSGDYCSKKETLFYGVAPEQCPSFELAENGHDAAARGKIKVKLHKKYSDEIHYYVHND